MGASGDHEGLPSSGFQGITCKVHGKRLSSPHTVRPTRAESVKSGPIDGAMRGKPGVYKAEEAALGPDRGGWTGRGRV